MIDFKEILFMVIGITLLLFFVIRVNKLMDCFFVRIDKKIEKINEYYKK